MRVLCLVSVRDYCVLPRVSCSVRVYRLLCVYMCFVFLVSVRVPRFLIRVYVIVSGFLFLDSCMRLLLCFCMMFALRDSCFCKRFVRRVSSFCNRVVRHVSGIISVSASCLVFLNSVTSLNMGVWCRPSVMLSCFVPLDVLHVSCICK